MRKIKWFLLYLINLFMTISCAELSVQERIENVQNSAHPRSAAYAADHFYLRHTQPPEKEVIPWEFYFKHCILTEKKPYPDRNEFKCRDPIPLEDYRP